MSLGARAFRWRWAIFPAWAVGLAALWLGVAPSDPGRNEAESLLPESTPYRLAVRALEQSFPDNSGLSQAVVVFERADGPLTAADRRTVERIADRIRARRAELPGPEQLAGIKVRSPRSIPLPDNPLVSARGPNGQAALIMVNVPAHFVSLRAARVVRHLRAILAAETLPDGLAAEVTGSCAFGNDYAVAGQRSHKRTLQVTVLAVIVILLLVYRAPLAACVPLLAISLAAAAVIKLLDLGQVFGMYVGTAEHIFVIVLLYGAGTDYSLMLISRYREYLAAGAPTAVAAASALDRTGPAILASAATDMLGLLMLSAANFRVFRSTGPAVVVGLATALLAALTLVPALLGVLGPRMFWPDRRLLGRSARAGRDDPDAGTGPVWRRLAGLVTRRPATVLLVTLVLLALPALQGARVPWVYDTLTDLGDGYGAVRGARMAQRHWSVGQIAPVTVLLRSDLPLERDRWRQVSERLTDSVAKIDGVHQVRSLSAPLGRRPSQGGVLGRLTVVLDATIRAKARPEYLSSDRRAIRLVAVLDRKALTLEAMDVLRQIRRTVEDRLAADGLDVRLHLAGATAQMIDVRGVTQRDFYRVAALALGAILLVILLLLRDLVLSLFMTAATLLSYLATLGITYWVFAGLFGDPGLDWKVEVFLFVVMVAVGVDYSIFLAARIAEEARRLPARQAIRVAVAHTGPVISSCGIIMAATLGSLAAGDFKLMHQLGVALALGMLVDTFVTRPLLLPAFAALTGRTGRRLDSAETDARGRA